MIFWAIAATAAAVIASILLFLYRRQVKTTCRQLSFLKNNETNMRLTYGLPFPELHALADNMNDILDMTQHVRTESAKSEQQLKETITSLSHDIRTPLTSMDGYFQLLIQSKDDAARAHYMSVIQSRIGSLKDMLEALFTYTKLQDSEFTLETDTIDFSKCVYETVFSFYDEFQSRGIEPDTDFCDGHLMIAGNREAILRIIQNLMKNALLHGQKHIALRLFMSNGHADFSCVNDVENPEEIDISKIFGRFYKADTARTKSSTGLGLSIAKTLTEKMGGTLTADLCGHIFTITVLFPLKK